MMRNLILIGIVSFLTIQFSFSCKNYYNKDIDFFILKKSYNDKNYSFIYPIENNGKKIVKIQEIEETVIIPIISLTFFKFGNYNHILYNDAAPKGKSLNPLKKIQLAKGGIIWDKKENGTWFAHRFDNYLPEINNFRSFYGSRQTKIVNNQVDFVCLSLNSEGVAEILKYLFYMNVKSYQKKLNSGQELYDEIQKNLTEKEKKSHSFDIKLIHSYPLINFRIHARRHSVKRLNTKTSLLINDNKYYV